MKTEIITSSEKQTFDFAKEMAAKLRPGSILCLDGDLGAGKTVFTKGVCEGLGVKNVVNSPTYTLVNEYQSDQGKVFHFDVYRIGEADELYDIGFHEYLDSGAFCIIEWGTRAEELLSQYPNVIYVEIKKTDDFDDGVRKISIR